MKDKKIRVAVIEDDKPFRIYLESEIRKMSSCQFDYAIASLDTLKQDSVMDDYNPDVLLLDMALEGVVDGGIKAIEFLKKKKRKMPKILIVSGYCDSWMIQMMKQKEGVNGCIRKSILAMTDYTFLESIIKKAYQGHEFIVVLDEPFNSSIIVAPTTKKIKKLTEIQEEILQRLAQDQTQNDIANYMKKPVTTINNTVAQLRKKFKVETTPKLLMKVKELGYLN